jgi:hypothetical protein
VLGISYFSCVIATCAASQFEPGALPALRGYSQDGGGTDSSRFFNLKLPLHQRVQVFESLLRCEHDFAVFDKALC